jgi:hypothetical protein
MAGLDTTNLIQNVYESAYNDLGWKPNFWIRYFNPCPDTSFSVGPTNECIAAWKSGTPHIGAVTSPPQSRLAGTQAEGLANAETFCLAISQTWLSVGPLKVPTNGILLSWLDQEASYSLSVPYWNGWATYVGEFTLGESAPLWPALYCDPVATPPNCSTIGSSSVTFACAAVWSSTYETCVKSDSPTWDATSCSAVSTHLWQYAESPCWGGPNPNVDLDVGANGINNASYCFYLSKEP